MALTFHHPDFPTGLVLEAKARVGRTVSVCIPARDEGSTVGSVVRAVVQPFLAAHGGNGLVDEVIVLDDGSRDDTAEQARDAGARVVVGPGGAGGKGQAMAAALGGLHGRHRGLPRRRRGQHDPGLRHRAARTAADHRRTWPW